MAQIPRLHRRQRAKFFKGMTPGSNEIGALSHGIAGRDYVKAGERTARRLCRVPLGQEGRSRSPASSLQKRCAQLMPPVLGGFFGSRTIFSSSNHGITAQHALKTSSILGHGTLRSDGPIPVRTQLTTSLKSICRGAKSTVFFFEFDFQIVVEASELRTCRSKSRGWQFRNGRLIGQVVRFDHDNRSPRRRTGFVTRHPL